MEFMQKLRMMPLRQGARDLFVGTIRAEDVIRFGRVAEWRDGDDSGYQRAPEVPRIRKVAAFLENDASPLLPTSILLSHRGAPLPKRVTVDGFVEIDLPDQTVLYIVDGQHRVAGLQMAIGKHGLDHLRDFLLPVVLMEFGDVREEANQFRVINETAKKVNTMLARRLLELRLQAGGPEVKKMLRAKNDLWQADSVVLIRALKQGAAPVWADRIQAPNDSKLPTHVVRELSVSTSLKPILTDPVAADIGLDGVGAFLANYWLAWRDTVPEAFAEPSSYVIQKTQGVFSLHMVARYVLKVTDRRRIGNPTVDALRQVLAAAGDAATSEYWRSANPDGAAMAGSMAGFKILADTIVEELQDQGYLL
jgi:DGQHR domain-containing protein